jgi:tubulin polyglutamylase TTLL6/13
MDEDQLINEECDSPTNDQDQSEENSFEGQSPSKFKKSQRKILLNTSLTKYSVVRKAAKHYKWKISKKEDDENWDVFWTDAAVQPEKLSKMKLYQKINHFPGMYALARKNYLAKNLNRLRKVFPKDFAFFPKTWLIPAEYSDLVMQSNSKKKKVFIVKPEASCQGRGIFLTKRIDDFSLDDRYVVQEYLRRPFLIDNLKFDLRIYVLLAGCDPLRIYLFKEGLARFATEAYVKPTNQNLSKQCMHLTNYAINKNSDNFVFNEDPSQDDVGHKRSLTSTFKYLADLGHDTEKLWEKIKDLIIKTLCAVQPSLAHTYKACQPDDPFNGMCFELLGFDVILDYKLKPWLLEVNHSPSFTTDSPLDLKVKFDLISQSFKLLNIRPENRQNFANKQKREIIERSVSKTFTKNKDKKAEEIAKAQIKRDQWEDKHLGDFIKIYHEGNLQKYAKFIESAAELWKEWTGGNKNKKGSESKSETKQIPVKVENKQVFSVRQSKTCNPQGEKNVKSRSVFERLSQKTSKKPSIVDQTIFPGIKLEDSSTQPSQLPSFLEFNSAQREKPAVKVMRGSEFQIRTAKEKVKYSDLPILIQSMLGNTKGGSNERLGVKVRNMTPAYRKKPYQYVSNLSYYKKWDLNE